MERGQMNGERDQMNGERSDEWRERSDEWRERSDEWRERSDAAGINSARIQNHLQQHLRIADSIQATNSTVC
jgi:hypothetical protein